MQRRSFLRNAATAAASIPLSALATRVEGKPRPQGTGYGPLVQALDETTGLPLLMLPEGFRYLSFGWTGNPMIDGAPTPGAHDGMAALHWRGHRVRLVRNHEQGTGTPFGAVAYDLGAAGGTTTVEFDQKSGEYLGTAASLSGTVRNCAGGPTLWGSWLTCEETTDFNATTGMPHGYIFDVPADGTGNPAPIRDMGRFSHEAVAVDHVTGFVYETEDAGGSSGFYRFVPNKRNRPAEGGRLFMLKVATAPLVNLGASYPNGTTVPVEWVEIATPTTRRQRCRETSCGPRDGRRVQPPSRGSKAAGTGNDGRSTSCRPMAASARGRSGSTTRAETIQLLFQSPGALVLNNPDNLTVSPRGGLVLCEDGGGEEFVHGLTVDGKIFHFAKNTVVLNGERNGITGNFAGSEFAGACYSPNGQWLFVNVQNPGISLAITGPWENGAL